MQNYNKNLAVWAQWALSATPYKDGKTWANLHTELSKADLEELMAILAGFMGASEKGRAILTTLL